VLAPDNQTHHLPASSYNTKTQAKLNCKTDADLAEKLLKAGVALVPGSAFATPGHMRISFATSDENLQKAIERPTTDLA